MLVSVEHLPDIDCNFWQNVSPRRIDQLPKSLLLRVEISSRGPVYFDLIAQDAPDNHRKSDFSRCSNPCDYEPHPKSPDAVDRDKRTTKPDPITGYRAVGIAKSQMRIVFVLQRFQRCEVFLDTIEERWRLGRQFDRQEQNAFATSGSS
jgi:hypothetical protein